MWYRNLILFPLFLLYVNDIDASFKKLNLIIFADDTNLLFPNKILKLLVIKRLLLTMNLAKICYWL